MQDNSTGIIIGATALVVVALGIFFFARAKRGAFIETITQDTLTMKEVIAFFQQDSIIQELERDSNLLAVVVRERLDNGRIKLILTLFNKQENKIANTPKSRAYIVASIDSDLEQNLGNRDMLVLE